MMVYFERKKEDSLTPYDAKKSVWVPDGEGGYDEAMIDGDEKDGKIAVKVGWEPKTFKVDQLQQVNPPKMEKFDDISNMTYLNEASVLWNLKARYVAKLIYTYSGLFCVVINPYKRYPIYTNRVVKLYIGKRRNEVPPHLFAASDELNILYLSFVKSLVYEDLFFSLLFSPGNYFFENFIQNLFNLETGNPFKENTEQTF